jgi:predicted transcriptional regulator
MDKIELDKVVSELLNKDRLRYLDIIRERDGAKSLEIAEEILRSRNITDSKAITTENIKVNKRLRKLEKLAVLTSKKGKYNISSLGRLLIVTKEELEKNAETMDKFRDFFEEHFVDDLPKEFFRQIYKLRKAHFTEIPVQWVQEVMRHTEGVERKFYNMTEYLHDIPEMIIERKIREKESRKKEEIEIVIIYQFRKYPQLNYSIEEDLFKKLRKAGAEFRYIELGSDRRPIGIRIVDEKWATFGLARRLDGELDREKAFIGSDPEFIAWCRDLMYHMWSFKARKLDVEKVVPKKE